MSSYPGLIDNFTHRTDLIDKVMAVDVNELQDAVEAIETELGTDPAGTATDVKTRLAKSLSGLGLLLLNESSAKTISGGDLTIDSNYHSISGEGSTDDTLTSISGGTAKQILVLRNKEPGTTITIQNGGGLYCTGGVDISLAFNDVCWLYYDGASWFASKGGGGGGGGGAPTTAQYVTLATDATLTAERVLTAGSGIGLTDGGAGNAITVRVRPEDINIVLHGQVYG